MVRRNHPKQLSQQQVLRFMDCATSLHRSLTEPLISTQCEHFRSAQKLHAALLLGILEITGSEAPWIYQSNSGPATAAQLAASKRGTGDH